MAHVTQHRADAELFQRRLALIPYDNGPGRAPAAQEFGHGLRGGRAVCGYDHMVV